MIKSSIIYNLLVIVFGLITVSCFGQLSPGDLTKAHAYLEGIKNCTQCHDIGNKISDAKCLQCHDEIQSLISQNRGYHASDEVKYQSCIKCHNEHHGRKFNMVRFDDTFFDHDLTGYSLDGEHQIVECRACHTPDFIDDPDIREREDTYLGLENACLNCHDDFHQNTLSTDCLSCHDMNAFRPASEFNHDEAEFILAGAHIDAECISCHQKTTINGVEFQEFVDLEFSSCISCHDDPHKGNLNNNCVQCHTESSFNTFNGNSFNHDLTNFELKGQHASVTCFDCHTPDLNPINIFQDFITVAESECMTCHDDVHEGKFGSNCGDCHNENSFHDVNVSDLNIFDHDMTDYPLEGQHVGLDCRACHTAESFKEPIDFTSCKNCHDDYHNGEFTKNGFSPDCIECHSLNKAFNYTLYGLEEHQESIFLLEGAHIAIPCFSCHLSEDQWTFRNIGSSCVDCHDDIHKDIISGYYYPDQDCLQCHQSESWASISFDHSLTDWVLDGGHESVDCRECHYKKEENVAGYEQEFNGLSQDCISCHENPHDTQFEENGITDCKKCHSTIGWYPTSFDHDRTAFPLEGKHAEAQCAACHKPQDSEDPLSPVEYKMESFECIDCHL